MTARLSAIGLLCAALFACAAAAPVSCNITGVQTQTTELARFSQDWGNQISRVPRCVAFPVDALGVQATLKFAELHRVAVVVRGAGHSAAGQTLVSDGIVLSSSRLLDLEVSTAERWLRVGSGHRWEAAVDAAYQQGYRLAGQTDSITKLNVGGTLSVAALNSLSFSEGATIDHIIEMQVVTGGGDVVTCSNKANSKLFNVVRGGLGQYAVIVWVKLPLIPLVPLVSLPTFPPTAVALPLPITPTHVLSVVIMWTDAGEFYDDLLALSNAKTFDGLESYTIRATSAMIELLFGAFMAAILAPTFNVANPPPYAYFINAADLFPLNSDLSAMKYGRVVTAVPQNFREFSFREQSFLELASSMDFWTQPKAVQNLYLPLVPAGRDFFVRSMAKFAEPQWLSTVPGWGFAFTPGRYSVFAHEHLYMTPDYPLFYNFYAVWFQNTQSNICPGQPAVSVWPAQVAQLGSEMVQVMADEAAALFPGFKFYPQSNAPYCWSKHYGSRWAEVQYAKRHYDPLSLLGSGAGVFRPQPASQCDPESAEASFTGIATASALRLPDNDDDDDDDDDDDGHHHHHHEDHDDDDE